MAAYESESDLTLVEVFGGVIDGDTSHRDVLGLSRQLQSRLAAFMLEYKFGLDEVLTKINILREEFELGHDYSPIEHVKSRVKSIDSLGEKVQRIQCPPDLDVIRERVRDIAGVRVTCTFVKDVSRFALMLTQQRDLTVLELKDYVTNPKPNGYRSLHVIVSVPVFLSDRTVHIPVEVQIRTMAMDFWASVEHQVYYKYGGRVPEHLRETLSVVARTAAALDLQMEHLREEVRSLAIEPS